MPDAGGAGGPSVSEGAVDAGMESSAEAVEIGSEGMETVDSELCSDKSDQELFDISDDLNEYEVELMDFSYEAKDPSYQVDMETHYNENGDPVGDVPIVTDDSFLVEGDNYVENGEKTIDWSSNAENSDAEGFDKDVPVTYDTLPPETIISRHGSERGRYGTDKGTDYSELSLPYDPATHEYHEYKVLKPVTCKSGIAAKNFGQKGGGKQFFFQKHFQKCPILIIPTELWKGSGSVKWQTEYLV